MKKAVFWDFDGTLVYPNEAFISSLDAALKKHHYIAERAELVKFVTGTCSWFVPERTYVDRTYEGWWDTLLEQVAVFCKHLGVEEAQIASIAGTYKENILHYAYKVYEDAEEVLSFCIQKGYVNYLLTNNYPEIVNAAERLGLRKYFRKCFVSSHIGYEKPRSELYEYARKEADYPDVCYMIGDNPIADIQGAQNAGITAILVHKHTEISQPDFTCDQLVQIKDILV